jgi:hypothetical protein
MIAVQIKWLSHRKLKRIDKGQDPMGVAVIARVYLDQSGPFLQKLEWQ